VTSEQDAARVAAVVPEARVEVVPNAVDPEHFLPRDADPRPDGRTIVFFGAINYFPNTDGILFFLREVWPLVSSSLPGTRLEIVGPRPPPSVLAHRGPTVEVTGFVEDLRPYLSRASVAVVPLRLGGGTRLKIVEAMAMGKAIVSTSLGAEGIDVRPGVDLLLEDDPRRFADAVVRVLRDRELAVRLGASAREVVVARYSWAAAAAALGAFFGDLCWPSLDRTVPTGEPAGRTARGAGGGRVG
jgi:glycosyltransferase involved in cell wall biosynthesis